MWHAIKTFSSTSLAAFLISTTAFAADCAPDSVDIRWDGGQMRFTVEVADDAAERAQGLMFREELPARTGMLFVYPKPQPVSFWMRNTPLSLDIIFADASGTVQSIAQNAKPFDETSLFGGSNIQYVLEVIGGTTALFGIKPGAEFRSTEIDAAEAAWPCGE